MNESARVAMLMGVGNIELREERITAPGGGGMLVRVRAALTDGTDLKAYRRGHPHMPMPTPFGHEFSGDVAAVGSGVTQFAVADPVMCAHTAPCGACYWCHADQEELCERLMPSMVLGAYADYVQVPAQIVRRNCFLKPAHLSYREAAFLEPLSCVVHSLCLLQPKGIVVVIGDGAFGILHALVVREMGASPVLVGRRPERIAVVRQYGLEAIDARSADVVAAVRERTDDRGADAAVECTGSKAAWELAPALVRRGGTASLFGGLPSETSVAFSAHRLHYDEVRLLSPFHFTPRAVRTAYDLLCRRAIDVLRLVTHAFPLESVAEAFERLDAGEGMKACIEP